MQAILSKLRNTSRSNSTVWIAMLVVLTMCLCAATASASGGGGIVVSQVTPLAGFPNGGALASGNAAGTTMAVNVDGNILTSTTYGNSVIMVNGRTGVVTTIGTFGNVGPVIVDGQSNLYVAGLYTNNIAKVPFVNGAYVDGLSSFSNTTPACTGSDTTVCLFSGNLTNAGNGYYFGVVSMAFDSSGNFFWAMTDANTAPNSIWECTVACLATGTPAAKLIWQEPAAATGDWMVGALAVDPWGRVFFTDSDIKNNTSYASNLYELPVSEGLGYGGVATGFAATPTLIENLTPATPGAYDDELDGLAIDPGSGTIYFATQYDGVWAIPNNSPGPILENIYQVSNQGAKTLALDGQSNAYVGTYNNSTSSDGILFISVNNLIAPLTAPGVAAAVPGVTALDSVGDCATGVLTFDFNGANPGDFAAAVSAPVAPAETTCSASKFGVGSVQPLTVTFTPTAGGTRSAGLLVTDVANYGAGAASISGQALLTQTITFAPTSPVTFDVGTITLAATGGDSGNPVTFSLISGPATLNSESGDQLTLTGVGSIVVAANQAGNAAYAAATEVQATIVVTPGVQVITFTSPTTVTFSTTPFTLTATGGGSGAPVNFTVLEGYALQSGTNGQTLTFTDYGSLSIRASQAGDANWLPATAQENITVNPGGQTADPIFTPPGGTFYMPQGVSVTMSDPTPGSVIYYNMNLNNSPTTDDIVYKNPIAFTSVGENKLQAVARAPGYTQSSVTIAFYEVSSVPPDFSATITPPVMNIVAGLSGTATLTVTGIGGFDGVVTFACSGLPVGAICGFSPSSVQPNPIEPDVTSRKARPMEIGSNSVSTTVTVYTLPVRASLHRDSTPWFPATTLAAALCFLGFTKRRRLQIFLLAVVCMAGMGLVSGCAGHHHPSNASSNKVTVTATSGTLQHTVDFQLNVQ